MTVRLRESLAALPAYVPGRTVPGAVKLASNESPSGPLPHVLERIAQVTADVNRYPDNSSTELTAALARRHGVDPARVAVGCGSVSLCQQLVNITAGAGDEVVHPWRSFEAYPIVVAVGGATGVPVPLTAEHRQDLPAMAAAVTPATRLVFICNPNNPTGTSVTRTEIEHFLASVPDDLLVVLDEAYREYVTDPEVPDGVELLADHPNLVVLRTFSKAYGLAGLRVGYAVSADPAITTALRQVQAPFAVTTLAQQAALASLEPPAAAQLRDRVATAVAERERVRDALLAAGYEVPPSQGNFVWLPLGADTVAVASALEDHHVIVRAFAGDGIRVTVSSPDDDDAFLAAVAAITPVRS
ncbi:histidinol-phosphate transaminase [Jatrophihabitans sp. YIM 134969]